MIKILLLFVVSFALFKNSFCFHNNFSTEVQTIKNVLAKWESKELKLNIGCAQQLYQVLENMLSFDDGFWAYKMIDATGKFPAGLAEGNVAIMGNFDECLKISGNKKNIHGNYCSITVDISSIDWVNNDETIKSNLLTGVLNEHKLRKAKGADVGGQPLATLPVLGVCLPDKCTADDINNALPFITSLLPLDINCQTQEDVYPPLDTGAIVTLTLFGIVTALMVVSSIYDYFCQVHEVKPHHPVLIAFSAYTNGKKLFRISGGQGELACLNGIRFLSMCWVILGHVFIANMLGPTFNLFEMLKYSKKAETMIYLQCALAVDSFFVISGLLVSYNFMKKMKKGEKFNIVKYYVHRYLRLTPAYAVVILVSVYLLKYLGSGPLYYQIDTVISQLCRDHWWKAILYLQNYLAGDADICVSQSWNLNIDYQLYVLSPIFLFLIYKTPKFGTLMMILPIIGCMVAGYVITYQKHLTTILVNGNTTRFMHYYYLKTHTRAATWFIGALLGYYLGKIKFYNNRSYLRLPGWLAAIIWGIVLAVIPTCVFAGHDMLTDSEYHVVGNSLYNTFVRPTWALCICWIIFASTIGYGGIINKFLSLPIFGLLSKFTYSIYLLHLTILYMMVCARKVPAYFSVAGLMSQFCLLFIVSFLLAIYWILAFEMPILVIEPYIFGSWGKPSRTKEQVTNKTATNGEHIRNRP